MVFEKLIEQHRVHGVVTHSIDLVSFIAHHQGRIHLGDFFGDQTELWPVCLVALVVKVTGLSARIASLVLSIALICFLNRREELAVPSCPAESISTGMALL